MKLHRQGFSPQLTSVTSNVTSGLPAVQAKRGIQNSACDLPPLPPRSGFVPILRSGTMTYGRTTSMTAGREDLAALTSDPVSQLLLSGRAETLREAEELY